MKKLICLSFLATMSLSACATVIRGNTENIAFTSSPQGARVSTSTGVRCTTPCDATIHRKNDFDATFSLNGQTKTVNVDSKASVPVGAAAVVGNAILGGVVGLAVDIGTGALKDHTPNPVHADFDGRSASQLAPKYETPCANGDAAIVGGTGYCY